MNISLDSIAVTISCPQCGQQLKETVGRLKQDQHITCPTCGRFAVSMEKIIAVERDANKALTEALNVKLTFKL